jgi:histidinol-phosphate aminotransferase
MTARFFDPLLRAELSELHSYQPNAGHFEVRLDANESPPLLSAEAGAAVAQAMIPAQYNRYPDPRAVALREAIAATCGASPEEVLVGTGSDEIIALLLTALDRPRDRAPAATIVTPSPTFVMYRLSARARGFKVVEVPLDGAWDLDAGGMVRAVEFARPNVIFVATPNNPTGTRVSVERLRAVIEAAPDALVVVDEAYVDFAGAGAGEQLALLRAYPNVAVMRTLSKVGFAALRVGWIVAPAELVREIDKTRQPYNLPAPSQQGATFVLRNLGGEIARMRDVVVAERARLAVGMAALGFSVTPSEANFLWVECARPADEVVGALAARGVLVKSFQASGGRLLKRMRVTVGLPGENDRLLHELAACR